MVSLQFFHPEDLPGVSYSLDQNQSQFTATAEEALQRIRERQDNLAHPVTIFYQEKAAGFFVLDFGNDKFDLTDNPEAVLVRSLSINPDLQGKGIGKSTMQKMDDFIRQHFEKCNEVVLAVNKNNTSAYELYLKTGYIFEGKTRVGRNGPQYLMYKKL